MKRYSLDPTVGKKYGRLLITNIYCSKRHKGGSRQRVKFVCDCGKKGNTSKWAVKAGKTISCGCFKSENLKTIKRLYKEGEVYGNVQLIKYLSEKSGTNSRKEYKCFCGKKFKSYNNPIHNKNGRKRNLHCGCLTKQNQSDSLKQPFKHIRIRYNSIKSRKDHKLELSFEEYVSICKKDCSYCGYNPFLNKEQKILKQGKYRPIVDIYNGVDRVNSDFGYIKNNVVPCCSKCNRMKLDLDLADFILHIGKIARHLKIKTKIGEL